MSTGPDDGPRADAPDGGVSPDGGEVPDGGVDDGAPDDATGPDTSATRERQLALLACLLGAALVLVVAGRTWLTLRLPADPPLPGRVERRTGTDLVPGLRELGLLGLAGVAAVLATKRLGRVVVGALVVVGGVSTLVLVGRLLLDPQGHVDDLRLDGQGLVSLSSVTALTGGVLIALGGLLVVVRGPRWAALSARYDAEAARSTTPRPDARPEVTAWDALDRGEDPTRPGAAAAQSPAAGHPGSGDGPVRG